MAFTPFNGTGASFRVATTTVVTANKWTAEMTGDPLDVSNFEGGGYSDVITGLLTLKITLELDLDAQSAATNPWDATGPGLIPSTTLANVRAYQTGTSSPFWGMAVAKVLSCSQPMDVHDKGKATFTIQNKGLFLVPSGAL